MLVGMEPAEHCRIESTREFTGPWWLAVALLEIQLQDVVEPALNELPSLEIGPVLRAGTEASLALRWQAARDVSGAPMTGQLRIVEVDGNCTELTLTGDFAGPPGREGAVDEIAERLARRIEVAVAREIGTQ
jgi:hypothetical protein